MFSKALFKQSCKANGVMWTIITFAVCFMLSCVMLISGNGNIGEVKNSIQDTIIVKEVDAQLQSRALSYYGDANDGLERFDTLFSNHSTDALTYLGYLANRPNKDDFLSDEAYQSAVAAWQSAKPTHSTSSGEALEQAINAWQSEQPQRESFESDEAFASAMSAWQEQSPATQENAVKIAYTAACGELKNEIAAKAESEGYAEDSAETQEKLGAVLYALNPNGAFDEFYEQNGESVPETYDYLSLLSRISTGNVSDYIRSEERVRYRSERADECVSVFLAGNMTKEENVSALMNALSSYGVTEEKYRSFGYTYASIKNIAKTSIATYRGREDYEIGLLTARYENDEFADENEYAQAIEQTRADLKKDIASSFLSTLPSTVSEALEEIGQADLYTLIVGSIFYKLAGLLLPIIYMIMASNNLVAGQVDSGSMAYVLSTSTKRITVVFTQAVYLIGSLLLMFALTTVTGCVCLALVSEEVGLTYGNLILLNLGAFLVLFALSGLCFCTSCVFDRSKRSMALGGGLSIFALVAAMLGLFGSPVIPSVVRLDALNYFNYATIISLFDVVSIIEGTGTFVWKFAVLAALAVVGYIVGGNRFIRKDLPL